ncbi:MAG: type I 3-dehydroquinate dehydratase [Hydrogenothermaceae bacterium]
MVKLADRPLIALPVKDQNLEDTLRKAKNHGVDIIEVRVDQFSNIELDYVKDVVKKVKSYDFIVLITVRSKIEGGGRDIPDRERVKIFESVVDVADILDIEFSSEDIREEIINLAKCNGKLSLVSYHDFEKTPNVEFIQNYIDVVKSIGGDIVKFAFKVDSFEDVANIMCVTHQNRDKNIVAIAMGDVGKISRVAGFVFGSIITYTYIGESFAPGQIEISKLKEELNFYRIID